MTVRRYVYLFVIPYALLAGVGALGFAWTNAQEQTLRAHDAIVNQTAGDFREQCGFDNIIRSDDVPEFCERLR